jgi:hypothetical protein
MFLHTRLFMDEMPTTMTAFPFLCTIISIVEQGSQFGEKKQLRNLNFPSLVGRLTVTANVLQLHMTVVW